MRVLVLYAHPLPDSFHAALHAAAVDGLSRAGHQVDDCDLYAEGFNPVLSAEERRHYHDLTRNRAPVAGYVERLQAAEALVLCFPVWCFGPPAILKGFLDRVMLPEVSFSIAPDGKVSPKLTQLRRIAAVTTYGRPRWMAWYVGDPPRKLVTRYLNAVSGRRARIDYLALYHMNVADQAARSAFLARVGRHFAGFA
ncbi:MAG: NAD(P)H-dependent oxidoreductase [Thalassobaculales bacterium]